MHGDPGHLRFPGGGVGLALDILDVGEDPGSRGAVNALPRERRVLGSRVRVRIRVWVRKCEEVFVDANKN